MRLLGSGLLALWTGRNDDRYVANKQDEGLPGGVGLRTGLVRLLAGQMARSTVPPVSLTTRIAPPNLLSTA
jgi:hypothetical protein